MSGLIRTSVALPGHHKLPCLLARNIVRGGLERLLIRSDSWMSLGMETVEYVIDRMHDVAEVIDAGEFGATLQAGMMASRLSHRGHVIPALTDHLEG